MTKKHSIKTQFGFAAVTLIVFMAIATTITAAATSIVITNNLSASKEARSLQTYYLAESGIEEGLLHYLRNPTDYTSSLIIDGYTVDINITDKILTSTAYQANGFKRTIQVQLNNYIGGDPLIGSPWQEVF